MTQEERYYTLEAAGVDNWNGYDFAIEMAEENGYDWSNLSPEAKMDYLDCAGVDNWTYYSDAFEDY